MSETSAPFGDNGSIADRGPDGKFVRGNTAAIVHGATSAAFWQAAGARVDEMARAIVSDAGHGFDDAPEALKMAAFATARAALVEEGTFLRMLEVGGPATSADRSRACATRWSSASGSLRTWLQLVGLRRVPRPAESLSAALRSAQP